jgi:ABC-2 type transport system permease protein
LLVLVLMTFAIGLGMLMSALYVRFRDIAPIWDVVQQSLFYASPVLYVTTMVPEKFQQAYLANPIAAVLTQMRAAIVDPHARPIWDAIGDPLRLLVPAALVVGAFALGLWVFQREAPRIAENL